MAADCMTISAYLRSNPRARYQFAMSEREPALLRDPASRANTLPGVGPREPTPTPRAVKREAPVVQVAGFWRRFAAAAIDLAIVVPIAMIVTWIVSRIAGVHLPPSNLHVFDIDLWIDLVLATDPALIMGLALFLAIGLTYLLVFHIVVGRTLGMRVMKLRVIDVYGDRPAPGRCVARCAGYLASAATLFLGFLWIGFDAEKRGLQDWIAGTYVIRGT